MSKNQFNFELLCNSKLKMQFKNLLEITQYFADKQTCVDYLISMRWDGCVSCPHCASERIYELKGANKRFKCGSCRKQFSATKGTIFENSPIPLQKWFVAIYLMTSHKKGISSLQLSKDLGVTQKTAWFMLQRIRFAVKTQSFDAPIFDETVEVDETYIGGKNKNRHSNKKVLNSQGRSVKDKAPVFGLVERNGRVVAMKVKDTTKKTIQPIIMEHVSKGANIMSDEWKAYKGLDTHYSHSIVKHGEGIYVIENAHTNTIEGFWSLLKRGIIGIYHSVSVKHLDKYLDEFEYRYNTRSMGEAQRFENMVSMSQKRLTYKQLIA
jgi:transposase-like protein